MSSVTIKHSALLMLVVALLSACSSPEPTATQNLSDSRPTPRPTEERCSEAPLNDSSHLVTSWFTAHSDALITPPMALNTMRQFIAPHWAGNVMRLRVSNRYSSAPITFSNLHIAEEAEQGPPALTPNTSCALRFNGATEVTLAAGETLVSDPIAFPVSPFKRLGISFYAPQPILQITRHLDAVETPYMNLNGDSSADPSGDGFIPLPISLSNNFLLIEAIEVEAPANTATVVTVGDSITDGSGAFPDTITGLYFTNPSVAKDQRYPDYLAKRVLEAELPFAIANAGISGNELLTAGTVPQFGPALLERFDTDVLGVTGVTDVIIMIGTNDFGASPLPIGNPTPEELIEGLKQLVAKAHAADLNVLLGTLPPAAGAVTGTLPFGLSDTINVMHGTAEATRSRAVVNEWIRQQNLSDGIVDFERCLQDPANPAYLLPEYNSGDNLHPSPAGYQAMADCVDLGLLRGNL